MSADAALGLQRREVFGIQRALVFRERERHFAPVFGPHRGLERLASLFPDSGERLPLARIVEAGRGDFDAEVHEPHRSRRDFDGDRQRLPRRHFVGFGEPVRVSDALHSDAVLPGDGRQQRKEAVRRGEVGLHGLAGGVQKADETARDKRSAIGLAYRAVDPLGGGGRSERRGDEGHREPWQPYEAGPHAGISRGAAIGANPGRRRPEVSRRGAARSACSAPGSRRADVPRACTSSSRTAAAPAARPARAARPSPCPRRRGRRSRRFPPPCT